MPQQARVRWMVAIFVSMAIIGFYVTHVALPGSKPSVHVAVGTDPYRLGTVCGTDVNQTDLETKITADLRGQDYIVPCGVKCEEPATLYVGTSFDCQVLGVDGFTPVGSVGATVTKSDSLQLTWQD